MKHPSVRAVFLFGISCLFAVVFAAPASAHDSLKKSTPAANAVVSGLDEIELEFSAHVSFPVVVLHNAAGRRFESGTPRVDGSTVVEGRRPAFTGQLHHRLAGRLLRRPPHRRGDTVHRRILVGGIGRRTAPVASPVAGEEGPRQETGTPGWIWAVVAAVVVLGVAAVLVARGRKPPTPPLPDDVEDRPSGPENGERG